MNHNNNYVGIYRYIYIDIYVSILAKRKILYHNLIVQVLENNVYSKLVKKSFIMSKTSLNQ